MTQDEYMRKLDIAEAATSLALKLEDGAVKRGIYRVQLDGIAALRNNIRLGARPWEK